VPTLADAGSSAPRRARRLEQATIAWNILEIGVTVGLGIAAGSLALIAFGLDSIAEVLASGVVVWTLRGDLDRRRERIALRLVAAAFFLLAAVLAAGGVYNLATGHRPDSSIPGIIYLAVTAAVMYALARAKRRAELAAANHPLVHEARVTLLDSFLAVGVLVALVLNDALDWWWADSAAALLVAAAATVEGALALVDHESERSPSAAGLTMHQPREE
jgi:divalent metal cation (Fe/Co/Zn/Cd) transporter